MAKDKTCDFCHIEKARLFHKGQFLCNKHFQQFYNYGKLKDRTKQDLNEIVYYNNYVEIIIYDSDSKEKSRAIIDNEDVEKVINYKWHQTTGGYIKNTELGMLHRYILNINNDNDNLVVDHINHNTLDNRKNNLRVCTQKDNVKNTIIAKNNNSGVTGIGWMLSRNKWRVRISLDHKQIYLGLFDDFEEAIRVRQEAEIKYFGEFRQRKIIDGGDIL